MKEYIDKEEFLKRLNVLYNMLDNLEKMLYSSQLIELVDIPTSDVVERKKYDLLQRGYETLKHQLEKSWNRIDELDKLNSNIRDKIDKSIAEMREEYDNLTYSRNKTLGASFGIKKAIEILEKNLGE